MIGSYLIEKEMSSQVKKTRREVEEVALLNKQNKGETIRMQIFLWTLGKYVKGEKEAGQQSD